MTTTQRTDTHRPSVIIPEDYQFIAVEYIKLDDIGACHYLMAEHKVFQAHREQTGATWTEHEHGGTCHVCGTHCLYTAIFYHEKTNTYLRTGFTCASKLEMGDERRFRQCQKAVKEARFHKAGKNKSQVLLEEKGLTECYNIYEEASDEHFEERTITDIVEKLVRYGSLSDKQYTFLGTLLHQIDHRAELLAKRAAEKALAEDCPSGRTEITGTIISIKFKCWDEYYPDQGTWKMTVKDDRGFVVWGTLPSCLEIVEELYTLPSGKSWTAQRGLRKGDKVTFRGTLTPSDNDSKFGFFKRPSNAEVLELISTQEQEQSNADV